MIFITGGTGFLGKSLVPFLANKGHRVKVLVRPTSDLSFMDGLTGVETVIGDVTDLESLKTSMQGCDVVIHAAALFRFWGRAKDFGDTNILGTRNALDAAVNNKVKRFIHISSIAVVGHPPKGTIITEETPLDPVDAYQKSKLGAEKLAQSYQPQFADGVIILRLGALYGPWGYYAFNRLFFEDFLRGIHIQVERGARITFPCFVEDAAQAAEAAVRVGKSGEIYNICGKSLSHKKLNILISQLAGKSNWRINVPRWLMIGVAQIMELFSAITNTEPYYPLNLRTYVFYDWVVNSSKAQRELGFKPTSIEDGIKKTLAWYKSIGFKINT